MTVETGGREGREERVKLSIDITPALRRRIRLAAAERDTTLRELLIELVEEGLETDEKEDGR